MSSDPSLTEFIASHPDARELKRALAVHMTQLGFKHRTIQAILGVPSSFISTWKKHYQAEGLNRLRLGDKGSRPYLSADQRSQINAWLARQPQPSVAELSRCQKVRLHQVYDFSQKLSA